MRFFLVTFAVALVFTPALGQSWFNPEQTIGFLNDVTGAIFDRTTNLIDGVFNQFEGVVKTLTDASGNLIDIGLTAGGNTLTQVTTAAGNIFQIVTDASGKVISVGGQAVTTMSNDITGAAQDLIDAISTSADQVTQEVTDALNQLLNVGVQSEQKTN